MDRSTSYSHLREHLKLEFDLVSQNNEILHVKRRNGKNLVLMSEEDYNSWVETVYLMKSPKNHQHIMDAISSDRKKAKSLDEVKAKYKI